MPRARVNQGGKATARKPGATPGTTPGTTGSHEIDALLKLLQATERVGINSLRKLHYFIVFANNEGKSMAELAGKAKTSDYNEIQQAVIELSIGRYNAALAPELIRLGNQKSATPGSGRRKPIRLTAKGRRLYRKIDAFCSGRS